MEVFRKSLPGDFHKSLSSKVVTMAASRKSITCDKQEIFDTELIYSRVMALAGCREFDLKELFQYELSPIPTSLFDDNGDMRPATAKSALKKKLQLEVPSRTLEKAIKIIDGCAFLWTVSWPTKKPIASFVENFWSKILRYLEESDVYLVFDRYNELSIKNTTRSSRSKKADEQYALTKETAMLPAQADVLSSSKNKSLLIDILCRDLPERAAALPRSHRAFSHSLIITGPHEVPEEIKMGIKIARNDMKTFHEEADVIMTNQAINLAKGRSPVTVISDDTDVFLLLLHFSHKYDIDSPLYMEATSGARSITDITATKATHSVICPMLLGAHALTGCDTVSRPYGIGKHKALLSLQRGLRLNLLGEQTADIEEVIEESSLFLASCYGRDHTKPVSNARYETWVARTGNKKAKKVPSLKELPPTKDALNEHVKRAHLQVAVWKSSMEEHPPSLDPRRYGWSEDKDNKCLVAVTLPEDVARVPTEIQKLIKCGCASEEPCSTARCGCVSARVKCSVFCSCKKDDICFNPANMSEDPESEDEHDDDLVIEDCSDY